MITGDEVARCLDFIRDNASLFAKAKSERIYIEQYRKSKKAILIQEFEGKGTIQEKESYAYAHKDYILLLCALREAVEQEEKLSALLDQRRKYLLVLLYSQKDRL